MPGMEPHIQYAKTSDGVNIAFSTAGDGPSLVWVPNPPFCHVQLEWKEPVHRTYLERMATRRTLVRLDPRGIGLSDRDACDFSLNARVRDVIGVTDCIAAEGLALMGSFFGGAVAIDYAVRHPERVSHLILMDAFPRVLDLGASRQIQVMAELLARDWEMFTENVGGLTFGWGREEGRRYGEFARACIAQEAAIELFEALRAVDVSDVLSKISVPTLVVHHDQLTYVSMDMARDLASRIPRAQLVIVEGKWVDSVGEVTRAIDEFLGDGEELATPTTGVPGGFRTILFTDVEGSTALTDRLGDARARDLLREHERIVREALEAHGGSEVKTMGDGFMTSFSSATKALECAIAVQSAFAERNESAGEPIKVRIGLNAGEPIAEDDPGGRGDLFGTAVNMAARIAAQANGGEILASNVVRELVAGKEFLFSDRGDTELRGFEDPVRLYEVRWRE